MFLPFVIMTIGCGVSDQKVPSPGATSYSGTFFVDRWGQGRFVPQGFIDDKLLIKMINYEFMPVRIISPHVTGEDYKGPSYLTDFETIEPLPHLAAIRVDWSDLLAQGASARIRRIGRAQDAQFSIELENISAHDIVVDSDHLSLLVTVRHPPESYLPWKDQSLGWFHPRKGGPVRAIRSCSLETSIAAHDVVIEPGRSHLDCSSVSKEPVQIKANDKYSWKVTLSNWDPNEYELNVRYRSEQNRKAGVYYSNRDRYDPENFVTSNAISLDVLTDQHRSNCRLELSVRIRERREYAPEKPVPLEIVFRNNDEREMELLPRVGQSDLDMGNLIFCYGDDGRLLPLPSNAVAPKKLVIPPGETFVLPVDGPAGTVVARAVYYNNRYATQPSDKLRSFGGWHWSEHWMAPVIRDRMKEKD